MSNYNYFIICAFFRHPQGILSGMTRKQTKHVLQEQSFDGKAQGSSDSHGSREL